MGFSNYKIKFTDTAIQHLQFWHKTGQKTVIIYTLYTPLYNSPQTNLFEYF